MTRQRGTTRSAPLHFIHATTILLAFLCVIVQAQIGTTVCICAPSAYTMTLNFEQTCSDTAVLGDGIITTDCAVTPFDNMNVTNLVPVSIASIDILELDEQLILLKQESRFETQLNGDTFSYTSSSNDPSTVNTTIFPKAIQFSILGNNAEGDTLFFAALVVYETSCLTFPIIEEGSTLGWLQFTELTDPKPEVCPLVKMQAPSSSTKGPTPFRSTKAPSPFRSTKAPAPFRSSKAPSPRLPTSRAPLSSPTTKPTCSPIVSGMKGKSGKGKDKEKKKKGKMGGKGMSKDIGKGMSKGSMSVRGKGNEDDDGDDFYLDNIFDREECNSGSIKGKKGDGKGGSKKEYNQPATAPEKGGHLPVLPSVGWSWEDLVTDGHVPTSQPPDNLPKENVNTSDSPANESEYNNKYSSDSDATTSGETGGLQSSVDDHVQKVKSRSGVDKAFGSSAAMYSVLFGGVAVAIAAIFVWKRPHPSEFQCGKKGPKRDSRKNMVISLVHGTNISP